MSPWWRRETTGPFAGGPQQIEMNDISTSTNAARTSTPVEPELTPYLGLRARLSQTWINRWTILLLLVLIRTLLAIATLDDDLGTARKQALSMCTSVENVGSAMASMPHYMSAGVNELAAAGIEKAINGLMEMLILSITAVEEIILFVINMMTSTYVCLITMAVGGSLHTAISAAEDVGKILNSTVKDVGSDLSSAANGFESAMNGFLKDLNSVGNFLTGSTSKPPTIDLTSEIKSLNSLQLPTGYDADLQKLNNSIPTFDQVHNLTNTAIKLPFEEVKSLLNASLPRYTMNRTMFPEPAKEQLTFCSDNNGISDFFDDLVHIEQVARVVFLVVILVLAVLAMVPMAYREIRGYRFMRKRAALISAYQDRDPMDAVYLVARPYTSSAGLWLAGKVSTSKRRQTVVRWSIAYATTVPALFVLSLAVAGLLACLCQYILLKTIEKEIPVLTDQVVGFADKVINSLNNASEQWAIGTNKVISNTNNTINQDVFGWVNTTTTAMNHTLNVFVDEMQKALNATFGGTPLYGPIEDVLNCLLLLKIKGIENGLTWVHDHAHIDFPLLDNDTFSLGTLQKVSGTQADILATGGDGSAADDVTDAVLHVTNALSKVVRQEAIISTCILLIWFIIAGIGIVRALLLAREGGNSGLYTAPPKPPSIPPRDEKPSYDDVPPYAPPAPDSHHLAPTFFSSSGDHSGSKFNGVSYTLTPHPQPRLQSTLAPTAASASPILNTGFRSPNEKLGNVNGRAVDAAIRRPTHIRASSHGNVDGADSSPPPPLPSSPENPFLRVDARRGELRERERERGLFNPFADPAR